MANPELQAEIAQLRIKWNIPKGGFTNIDDQRIVNTILTNAGTIIYFKTNSPADEQQLLPLFNEQLQQGEIMNLPTYNFYIRLAGTEPQEPTSGRTLLPGNDGDENVAKDVIEASRENYATEYKEPPKAKVRVTTSKTVQRSDKAPVH